MKLIYAIDMPVFGTQLQLRFFENSTVIQQIHNNAITHLFEKMQHADYVQKQSMFATMILSMKETIRWYPVQYDFSLNRHSNTTRKSPNKWYVLDHKLCLTALNSVFYNLSFLVLVLLRSNIAICYILWYFCIHIRVCVQIKFQFEFMWMQESSQQYLRFLVFLLIWSWTMYNWQRAKYV